MIKKAIRDFCHSAFICKGLMAVSTSSLMQEIADYSLLFSSLVLWTYRFDRDDRFLRETFPFVRGVYEYFSSKEEILQGVARYCFAQENERIAARFDRCRTLVDLENELVDYLQEVAAQRMSTYRLLASSFGQQAALPECTNACRSQLTALTDALVARLQAAGEIDPGLTMDACRTSIFCTVTGGLIALCCSAGSGISLPALPQNLREALHRSLQAPK